MQPNHHDYFTQRSHDPQSNGKLRCVLAFDLIDLPCVWKMEYIVLAARLFFFCSKENCKFICSMWRRASKLGDRVVGGSYASILLSLATFSSSQAFFQLWASRGIRPWMCLAVECRHVNKSKAPACETCGKEKPVLSGWLCEACKTKNYAGIRSCKKCAAPQDKTFWRCAACNENNSVDTIDDNSRCGHCGYDMAPLSRSEEEIVQASQERFQNNRAAQEQFDSISAREMDEQTDSETTGFDSAHPPPWAKAPSVSTAASESSGAALTAAQRAAAKILATPIPSFVPRAHEQAKSVIGRRAAAQSRDKKPVTPSGPPGFDWMCRERNCGAVNGGDDDTCSSCNTPISPDEWECPGCAALNHCSRGSCFNCKGPIPVSWVCMQCRAMTSVYDSACRNCSAARPKVEPRTVRDAAAFRDGTRGLPKPRKADWSCPSCHMLNFASRTECFKCQAAKPGAHAAAVSDGWDALASTAPAAPVGDANWQCRSCGASNFRTRTDCWQCHAKAASHQVGGWQDTSSEPKFEKEGFQGGEDVPLAPGQVKGWGSKVIGSDDWTCSKCFSKNFRAKTECFKCGAAKSVLTAPRKAFAKKSVKI